MQKKNGTKQQTCLKHLFAPKNCQGQRTNPMLSARIWRSMARWFPKVFVVQVLAIVVKCWLLSTLEPLHFDAFCEIQLPPGDPLVGVSKHCLCQPKWEHHRSSVMKNVCGLPQCQAGDSWQSHRSLNLCSNWASSGCLTGCCSQMNLNRCALNNV